jgi:hypothetical protein
MKEKTFQYERGQVLVIIALALVGLLAFTALAIDGGMVYSDRRHAQNAADAAALAGALSKANQGTDAEAIQAALDVAAENNFPPDQVSIQISAISNLFGSYFQVRADLISDTRTSLMHLFGHGVVRNEVMAIAKTRAAGPSMPGMGIIAMGDCTEPGGPKHLININGGGNSGDVIVNDGGIFLNSADPGSSPCALAPPTSNTLGIIVDSGYTISSIGEYNYPGAEKISPSPIDSGINDGVRIGDLLEGLDEPQCTSNGSVSGGATKEYQPGRYGGAGQPNLGDGTLMPGIYCISGDVKFSGQTEITGQGITLYFIDGGVEFSGQASLKISAPTAANCLGQTGDRTASCTYKGIAMFADRSNTNTFDLRGNGEHRIIGTIYNLNGDVIARGGGENPDEYVVDGQIIARSVSGDGNGSFWVRYNESYVFVRGPGISLTK